jgi:tRNA A37 threonylcarbamoyladenosine synthetase subunit TsaC/SUA5/YrdC
MPEQKEIRRDTLLTGGLRITAVDSIKNLIGAMKDSVIYCSGAILSGSKSYITVTTNDKEISFQLHNASDTTAEKIVDILNSHIPAGYRKLHIFNPKQNRSKNQPTSSPS